MAKRIASAARTNRLFSTAFCRNLGPFHLTKNNAASVAKSNTAISIPDITKWHKRRNCHDPLETVAIRLDPVLKSCTPIGEEAGDPEYLFPRSNADLMENICSNRKFMGCSLCVSKALTPGEFTHICTHVQPLSVLMCSPSLAQQRA